MAGSGKRRRVVLGIALVTAVIVAVAAVIRHHERDLAAPVGTITSADLDWKPGINHPGPVVHTRLGARDAQTLAHAIAEAPRWPPGTRSCPADFASQVTIRYGVATGHYPQQVVRLTGCSGPTGHQMTDRLQRLLDHQAPPNFQKM